MTPKELADQIREVHRICQEWEDAPTPDSFHRPKWTRWFRLLPSILVAGAGFGFLWIILKIPAKTPWQMRVEVGTAWTLLGLVVLYCSVSTAIQVWYGIKDWKVFASPFSSGDASEVEDAIAFDERLGGVDHRVLEMVAASLECRAKRLENARLYVVGIASLAGAVGGIATWAGDSLRTCLERFVPAQVSAWLPLWFFSALVGGLVAIAAAWRCGIACLNRALTIRRVLDQPMTTQSWNVSEKDDSP